MLISLKIFFCIYIAQSSPLYIFSHLYTLKPSFILVYTCIAIPFDFILFFDISKMDEVHSDVFFSGNKHKCLYGVVPHLILLHLDGAKHPSLLQGPGLLAAPHGSPCAPGGCHPAAWAGCLPAGVRDNSHSSFSPVVASLPETWEVAS